MPENTEDAVCVISIFILLTWAGGHGRINQLLQDSFLWKNYGFTDSTTGFILAHGGPLGGMIGWFMLAERCITKTIFFLLIQQLLVKLLYIRRGFEWLTVTSQIFIILAAVISFFGDLRAPTISLCRTNPGQPWPFLQAPWCHHVELNKLKLLDFWMWVNTNCFTHQKGERPNVFIRCRVSLVSTVGPQTGWRSCSCYKNFHHTQMKWINGHTHTASTSPYPLGNGLRSSSWLSDGPLGPI